jgi:hypothetical protein
MMPKKIAMILFLVLVVSMSIVIFSSTNAANIDGDNYKNVTVRTSVNITNSKPVVLSVDIYQETNYSLSNITLNAGLVRTITCNATVRDYDGYTDITGVNATLFHSLSTYAASNNNNTHYTNSSCTGPLNGNSYTAEYTCGFEVYYYANNGTWNCTVVATDTFNKTGNLSNTTTIYPLYALNVTDGIDYGNVAVDDDSLTQTANVSNIGNMAINISLEGYGVTRNDGLAMSCSVAGNISVEYERFSIEDTGNWIDKINLTSSLPTLIPNLTISKQTLPNETQINTTYWQLRVPPNPAGNCTGFVIFSAEAP